uniref:Uncharacterized protein n=1 Tax=Vannella robusta TaxID=1487602 RepID=A0A7S4M594_9EUKA|mmetsp:Transcript_11782/g.14678  ORF Transcript_11782/g.14678 Transcript_11782/m.14678 type:complete len:163 (+) Transcript_11782:122-610(+)
MGHESSDVTLTYCLSKSTMVISPPSAQMKNEIESFLSDYLEAEFTIKNETDKFQIRSLAETQFPDSFFYIQTNKSGNSRSGSRNPGNKRSGNTNLERTHLGTTDLEIAGPETTNPWNNGPGKTKARNNKQAKPKTSRNSLPKKQFRKPTKGEKNEQPKGQKA